MNIRPMDLQVLIPRATDVAKSQQINDQQNMQQQQQTAAEWKKISDTRQQQVQSKSKSEGGKIRAKEEQEQKKHKHDTDNEFLDGQEASATENTLDHTAPEDPLRGHRIDIKM